MGKKFKRIIWLLLSISIASSFSVFAHEKDYTVLNQVYYRQIVQSSRRHIQALLKSLALYRQQSMDKQIAFIAHQLTDLPYLYDNAMGEGDWQSTSYVYKPHAIHINQNPVYRLDGFNCQTFVQVVLALLYAKNINEFDKHYLQIAYGAAKNPAAGIVRYDNRNHFIDADFNPVNERNGLLSDATAKGDLAKEAKMTSAAINRQQWLLFQTKKLSKIVQVFDPSQGPMMFKHFFAIFRHLRQRKILTENVTITYLPKTKIALQQADGSYLPNQVLLDKIPTPAIAEIVYDATKWNRGAKNIKTAIGTELNVAHLGLLYRQTFHQDEVIYRKITCREMNGQQKICDVKPIICQQKICAELMFAHATDAYPQGYKWYQKVNGEYTCSANFPSRNVRYTYCNRVETRPLFSYLTDYQFGSYWYMNWPAILGVHVEQLSILK